MRGSGLFLWFGFPLPIAERLALIREAGFDSTGVWIPEPERRVSAELLLAARQAVRDCGLFLDFAHAPYFRCNLLWSSDAGKREQIAAEYLAAIELCARGEMGTIVFHVVKGMRPPPPAEPGLEIVARLAERAAGYGVRIALENTRHPGYVDFLLERLPHEALGLCYDSSHDLLHSPRPGELLRRWKDRLFCTHLSATDGKADTHWIPEEDDPLFELLQNSFPRDYAGVLTMEVLPRPEEQAGTAAAFVAKARAALERIEEQVRGQGGTAAPRSVE